MQKWMLGIRTTQHAPFAKESIKVDLLIEDTREIITRNEGENLSAKRV